MLAHMRDFAGRVAALKVSGGCFRPDALQFGPCDVGDSCCLARNKWPSVTRGSHSAWSRRRHQSHSSPSQASSRGSTTFLANNSTLPKYLQSSQQVWTSPEAHAQPWKSSDWTGCGNNGDGTHRCSQQQWIRRERRPATVRICPGAAHLAHPSRMHWGLSSRRTRRECRKI